MTSLLQMMRRSIWLGWLFDNPLFVREIRRRMRGRLFSWSLIVYLCALGIVTAVLMFSAYPFNVRNMPTREVIIKIGKIGPTLFKGMLVVEGIIALFIAPMLTAGLATQEKEKDTFDFLRVTTLKASTFVAGCLLTTACFLMLVFSCTLPVLGLTFIFGGVSMQEIMDWNLRLFLAAMAVSAWGVFNSTAYRRSRTVHASIAFIFIIVFVFRKSFGFFLANGFLTPITQALNPMGRYLLGVVLPLLLCTFVLSLAAARRLYEPNNRLFNYKQYTFFLILVLSIPSGILLYRTSAASAKSLDATEITTLLNAFYFIGWLLLLMAVVLFSTGRIEMGDEIWRLRQRFPFFQKLDERIPLYGLFILLWLVPAAMMGLRWDGTSPFFDYFTTSLTITLASLIMVGCLARFYSALLEKRTHAAIAVLLTLLLFWGGMPLVAMAAMGHPIADICYDFSPIATLGRIWGGRSALRIFSTLSIIGAISLLALLPTLLKKSLRRRLAVSYKWRTRPPADLEKNFPLAT